MSKKSERKRRARVRKLKGALVTSLFGLFFLILGLIGYFSNRAKFMEYRNSEDVRMVEATVDYVDIRSRKGEYDKMEEYWKAKLKYTVDGKEYTGKFEYLDEVKKGDVKMVEVYRTKKGEYLIPEYTTDSVYNLYNIFYFASIGLGLFFLVIVIIVLLPDKDAKKKRKKQQNKNHNSQSNRSGENVPDEEQ
jgi:hypothetical protein